MRGSNGRQKRKGVRSFSLLLLALALTLIWLIGSHLVAQALPNDNNETDTFRALRETPSVITANPRRDKTGPRVVEFGLKLAF